LTESDNDVHHSRGSQKSDDQEETEKEFVHYQSLKVEEQLKFNYLTQKMILSFYR
jgi:hypothetical protein